MVFELTAGDRYINLQEEYIKDEQRYALEDMASFGHGLCF